MKLNKYLLASLALALSLSLTAQVWAKGGSDDGGSGKSSSSSSSSKSSKSSKSKSSSSKSSSSSSSSKHTGLDDGPAKAGDGAHQNRNSGDDDAAKASTRSKPEDGLHQQSNTAPDDGARDLTDDKGISENEVRHDGQDDMKAEAAETEVHRANDDNGTLDANDDNRGGQTAEAEIKKEEKKGVIKTITSAIASFFQNLLN